MAKQQSLAAQSGTLATAGFKMPAVFGAPREEIRVRELAPYVTFAHPKRADEWNKLVGKFGQVGEGDTFLIENNELTRLDSWKASILYAKQYWAETNPAGEVLSTVLTEHPKPYKEHIEAVLFVLLPERIVVANVQARTTKCGGIQKLDAALTEAATQAWFDKSPAHKETMAIGDPFMRFYGEMTMGPSRTSRTSGLPYRPLMCNIKPTGVAEARLWKEFSEGGEATQKAIDDAGRRFEFRMEEVTKKLRR